jgi:hypothetical protein
MAFARHETFYLRDGWLRKGLKNLEKYGPKFFRSREAADVLGMGKNMVNSLRFWLQATGLMGNSDKPITYLAQIINEYDPYFEDIGTLWLIHYELLKNEELSTTWYWFFNVFKHKEFDEEMLFYWLKNYTIVEGMNVADSSLKKDISCFINSYLSDKSLGKKLSPEDNINCPLRDLQLLREVGHKTYRLNKIDRTLLDPLIVFFVIKKWQEEKEAPLNITMAEIMEEENNAGNVFCLNFNDLVYYLEKLQDKGYVSVTRTAGLDSVNLKNMGSWEVLKEYYINCKF